MGALHRERLRRRRRVDRVESLGLLRRALRRGSARAHEDVHCACAGERRAGVRAGRGQRARGGQGVQDQGEKIETLIMRNYSTEEIRPRSRSKI